ncbi:DUF4124 domain-containing protein [Gammaproteobacteria bacterium]|nr:DUF4124 domain-containing protein [Gammaproteobacteria bacterium]
MKFLRILVFNVFIALSLAGFGLAAHAQVYQSTDSDGSVILSDQPTPGSEAVVIPETNVGDSVDVPPPAPVPVVEAKPEIAIEELPAELQGELQGVEIKSKKKKRRRKQPKN